MTLGAYPDIDAMTPAEAAGFWDARLRSPDCTEADYAAHRDWHAASAANAREFEALQGVIGSFPSLAGRAEIESLRSSARDWLDENRAAPIYQRKQWALAAGAIAALLVLAFSFASLPSKFGSPDSQTPELVRASFATEVGGRSTVPLEDGSAVMLNTESRIDVHFAEQVRNVELIQGEAHFDVAHDTSRPFTVAAGDYRVTAIGTAFDVRLRRDGEIQVTVTEGRVAVTRSGQDLVLEQATQLGVGKQLRTSKAGPALRRSIDPVNTSSWRQGRAVFDDIPLASAIDEMNRYSTTKLVIEDPALAKTRISGMFTTSDQASFVEALEQYFAVSSHRKSETEILLESRSSH